MEIEPDMFQENRSLERDSPLFQQAARVCIASSGLGHVARGIEAWAADLGRALASRGLDVSLCKGGGAEEADYEKRLWCLTRDCPTTRRLLRITDWNFLWRLGLGSGYDIEQSTFAWGLLRHLRRTRADILHVQDPWLAWIVQQARRAGLIRTKTILAHGTEEPLSFLRRIEFLQHLAPYHAAVAREAGIERPTWTTIPNFIDTNRFAPASVPGSSAAMRAELGIPPDGKMILCVAAIRRPHKRIDYLLREVQTFLSATPNVPAWLVVAGGWEEDTDELLAEGKSLLGDRVRFLVRFPRERMPELYRAADLFVLTSLFEMMPIALLEAQSSGLPCIVNDHDNLTWAIGGGGMACDLAQAGNLAAALRELVCDPARLGRLSTAARRHCVDHFSEPVIVEQITDYYRQVCGRAFVAGDVAVNRYDAALAAAEAQQGIYPAPHRAAAGCQVSPGGEKSAVAGIGP